MLDLLLACSWQQIFYHFKLNGGWIRIFSPLFFLSVRVYWAIHGWMFTREGFSCIERRLYHILYYRETRGSGQGGWTSPSSTFFWSPSLCVEAAFYVYLSRVWVVVGVIEEGVTKAGRCSFPLQTKRIREELFAFSLPISLYLNFACVYM